MNDVYRDAVYPWNFDGSITEPICWKKLELKCEKFELQLKFGSTVCDEVNAKYFLKHFIGNSTRVTLLCLKRADVKNSRNLGFHNDTKGSDLIVNLLEKHRNTLRTLDIDMVDDTDEELEPILKAFLTRQNRLEALHLKAFLTNDFMTNLLKAVRTNITPLKKLYVKAYSFESDTNFVRNAIHLL